jgi:signal transduction histidine kinase
VPDAEVGKLLDAVLAVTEDLDLEVVLERVVAAACSLAGARYGALGVIAEDGEGLSQFVHTGLDAEAVARIGHLPEGRGLLGALVDDPRPLRLDRLADDPRSAGFPPGHPPMTGFLGAPIRVRDAVFGNIYLTDKLDGGSFDARDEELVIGLAAVAGAAIANARLVDDLRGRQRWRDAVLDLAVTVLSGGSTEVAEGQVAELACAVVDGLGAVVVVRDRDGNPAVSRTSGQAPPVGATPNGSPVEEVLRRGSTLRVGRSVLFPGAAVLWVPLIERGEVIAALGVGRVRPFNLVDAELLETFAAQASLVIAHGRASADLRRMGLVEDRERIGRDLHDTVIQRLFATGLSLQALSRRVEDRPDVAERLDRAVDDVDETVKQIRTTIFGLQAPPEVESVRNDVLNLVDEVGASLATPPRVRFDGPIDTVVRGTVANHLRAVLREALTNVVKHAEAEEVVVSLSATAHEIHLVVVDDGRGIGRDDGRGIGHDDGRGIGRDDGRGVGRDDGRGTGDDGAPGVDAGGYGLGNLRERARACGGHVSIGPPPSGRGTEVSWRVPVRS